MNDWQDYDVPGHTVVGTLKVRKEVHSPQLNNRRDVLVWLPPGYDQDERRYRVLYMHDGQNLFDRYTSYIGEWEVDETLTALAGDGIEAIVVGLPNIEARRRNEYCPFDDAEIGKGQGTAYLDFLLHTIKPMIDAEFRTLPDVEHTAIAGSSLGGLISLYALFMGEVQIFGQVGIFSPFLRPGSYAIFDFVRQAPFRPVRLYLDVGTREHQNITKDPHQERRLSQRYLNDVRRMRQLLVEKGYGDDLLQYMEDDGAVHNETAWARRLPGALRFLLS